MQLFEAQQAAVLQGRDGGDPAGGRSIQQGAKAKLLSKTDSLPSLEDKLCTLEKSESSSPTLSGHIQPTAVVKVEPSKCSTCHP